MSWRDELTARIDGLGRWLLGRVVVDPDPADELVAAGAFTDPEYLRRAITRCATITQSGQPGEVDLTVAASRFTRHYSASLTAVALVGLSHGVGVDLSAERCTMIIRHDVPFCLVLDAEDGAVLRCAERPAPWPVPGPTVATLEELRRHVWHTLYAEHLLPLFQWVRQVGRISPAVVWSNAAEWAGMISEAALEYLEPEAAESLVAECDALLDATAIPGLPDNPLGDKLEWVPGDGKGFPETVQTRRFCCLTYLLADRFGRLCQNCPHLPLEERIALVRERHGVPMGAPGGAAEQRAIQLGLARPATRHVRNRRTR